MSDSCSEVILTELDFRRELYLDIGIGDCYSDGTEIGIFRFDVY